MTPRSIFAILFSSLSLGWFAVSADETSDAPLIGEQPVGEGIAESNDEEVSVDAVTIRRTTVYNEEEIKRLYKDYKAHNEKMSEGLPAHLNSDEIDLVTLKPFSVEGQDLRKQRELMERLDPRPRRRLQRIADIDPDAAHEMMVTSRNDLAFMSGANDRRISAGNPGSSANFTATQMVGALDKAFEALGRTMAKKKKKADKDVK